MTSDIEHYMPSILSDGDLVCVMCDLVTSLSPEEQIKSDISNIYKGQVGVINYEIVESNENPEEILTTSDSLSSFSSRLSDNKTNFPPTCYSVAFIDFKQPARFDDECSFQIVIVKRKHLILLETYLGNINPAVIEKSKNFFKVATELQLKTENKKLKNTKKKEKLEKMFQVYSLTSIPHSGFNSRYNLGHVVTVQELLYEEIDINCIKPIVYTGQVGIISKKLKNNRVEVIFLYKNLYQYLGYNDDIEKLEKELNEIYDDPYYEDYHKEVRIEIEEKFLIPLYAEQLEFSKDGKTKRAIELLNEQGIISKDIQVNLYKIPNN